MWILEIVNFKKRWILKKGEFSKRWIFKNVNFQKCDFFFCIVDRYQCGKMRLFKLLLPTVKYYLNLQYFWLWEDAWWRNERSIINFIQKIMNHILHLSALLRSVWWEVWVLQEGKFFFNVTTQFVNCKKMTQFFFLQLW